MSGALPTLDEAVTRLISALDLQPATGTPVPRTYNQLIQAAQTTVDAYLATQGNS